MNERAQNPDAERDKKRACHLVGNRLFPCGRSNGLWPSSTQAAPNTTEGARQPAGAAEASGLP